mgnify:CR=1 FL=1
MPRLPVQGQAEEHGGGAHDEQAPLPPPAQARVVRQRHGREKVAVVCISIKAKTQADVFFPEGVRGCQDEDETPVFGHIFLICSFCCFVFVGIVTFWL